MENYQHTELIITEFDVEDVITTSGQTRNNIVYGLDEYEWIRALRA